MRGGVNPQIKQVLDWLKGQIGQADQVVEEWHSSANFYRRYASGYIEQGGRTDQKGVYNIVQTLHTPFSSKNYLVGLTSIYNGLTPDSADHVYPDTQTTTQFKCVLSGGYAYWYACGY